MKKNFLPAIYFGHLLIHLFLSLNVFSQKQLKKEESDTTGERSLILSAEYGSDRILYGEKLNNRLPYVAPSLSYDAPSGFFTSFTAYQLVNDSIAQLDEEDLEAGWNFKLIKKLNTSFSYSHFFYNANSPQLKSSLKNQLELYLAPEWKLITPKLYFDYLFSNNQHDFVMTVDLMHEFEIENIFTEDDALSITPTVSVYTGTLNYYSVLLKNGKLNHGKKATVNDNTGFGLTGSELSLPVEYDIGRFILGVGGYYNIPKNVSNKFSALEKAQLDKALKSTPTFYFTASVGFVII